MNQVTYTNKSGTDLSSLLKQLGAGGALKALLDPESTERGVAYRELGVLPEVSKISDDLKTKNIFGRLSKLYSGVTNPTKYEGPIKGKVYNNFNTWVGNKSLLDKLKFYGEGSLRTLFKPESLSDFVKTEIPASVFSKGASIRALTSTL